MNKITSITIALLITFSLLSSASAYSVIEYPIHDDSGKVLLAGESFFLEKEDGKIGPIVFTEYVPDESMALFMKDDNLIEVSVNNDLSFELILEGQEYYGMVENEESIILKNVYLGDHSFSGRYFLAEEAFSLLIGYELVEPIYFLEYIPEQEVVHFEFEENLIEATVEDDNTFTLFIKGVGTKGLAKNEKLILLDAEPYVEDDEYMEPENYPAYSVGDAFSAFIGDKVVEPIYFLGYYAEEQIVKFEYDEATLEAAVEDNMHFTLFVKGAGIPGFVTNENTVAIDSEPYVMQGPNDENIYDPVIITDYAPDDYPIPEEDEDLFDGEAIAIGDSFFIDFGSTQSGILYFVGYDEKGSIATFEAEETVIETVVEEDNTFLLTIEGNSVLGKAISDELVLIEGAYFVDDEDGCQGCEENNLCHQVGVRVKLDGVSSYCGTDEEIYPQKELSAACENNFECLSNQCSNGACIDIQKELEETRGVMQRILDWLKNLF